MRAVYAKCGPKVDFMRSVQIRTMDDCARHPSMPNIAKFDSLDPVFIWDMPIITISPKCSACQKRISAIVIIYARPRRKAVKQCLMVIGCERS